MVIQTVEATPAITMPELAARLLDEHEIVAAPAMLSRFLCRRGFSYKKMPHGGGVRTRRRAG
jgi:transposase